MRKSKEQVQLERQERQETAAELKKTEAKERRELEQRQQEERDAMREKQAARRKERATTGAGGARPGAGRKPSMPHKPNIFMGDDINPKKTYTFYGAADEKEPVKNFLQVWREMRFNIPPEKLHAGLEKLPAPILYKLMTHGRMSKGEQAQLAAIFPMLEKFTITIDD